MRISSFVKLIATPIVYVLELGLGQENTLIGMTYYTYPHHY